MGSSPRATLSYGILIDKDELENKLWEMSEAAEEAHIRAGTEGEYDQGDYYLPNYLDCLEIDASFCIEAMTGYQGEVNDWALTVSGVGAGASWDGTSQVDLTRMQKKITDDIDLRLCTTFEELGLRSANDFGPTWLLGASYG